MAPMQETLRISIVNLDLPSVAMDRSKELLSHTYWFAGRVSWFNPSQQLSARQPLAHSPLVGWGRESEA